MQAKGFHTWLVIAACAVGLVLLIPGLWIFTSLTSKPIHPSADAVPSVSDTSTVLPQWIRHAEQGRQIARAAVAQQNLPGLSVAVGVGGSIVWAEGFGYADMKSGERVTPKHKFRIGTASTALTSAAVGLLLESGALQLDQKLHGRTLRQLMANTGGINSDEGDEGPLFTRHCESPKEALPVFASRPPRFEPGTKYRFASYGWIAVSAAIEDASQQPFLGYMKQKVFDPLQMRDTAADGPPKPDDDFPIANLFRELIRDAEATRPARPAEATRPARPAEATRPARPAEATAPQDQATAYFPKMAADPAYGMHLMRPLDYSCYAGASVFVSTPSDLVRFGMAMQGGKLLKPETAAMLQTSQKLNSGQETGHGLGWYVKSVELGGKQTKVTGQDGESLGGMISSLVTLPDHGITVAVISNISFADTYSVGLDLARRFAQRTD